MAESASFIYIGPSSSRCNGQANIPIYEEYTISPTPSPVYTPIDTSAPTTPYTTEEGERRKDSSGLILAIVLPIVVLIVIVVIALIARNVFPAKGELIPPSEDEL
jgi:hypothetical protein